MTEPFESSHAATDIPAMRELVTQTPPCECCGTIPCQKLRVEQQQVGPIRGKCVACGYSIRLRGNGTVQTHKLWSGASFMYVCAGSGSLPREVTRGPF